MDAKGKDFDADVHEAITEIEAGEKMQWKVVDEVIKGYYLNDKIIRFAKVVVGKWIAAPLPNSQKRSFLNKFFKK
jgi:molecular chaperone GrpE